MTRIQIPVYRTKFSLSISKYLCNQLKKEGKRTRVIDAEKGTI